MTKSRAPVSIENALVRVAAHIGFPAMAEASGAAERTVRNWSDPDTPERCPVNAAIAIDLAYAAAGGTGFPIYEAQGLLLEVESAERFGNAVQLSRLAAVSAKEGGEAIAALITAAQPGATDSDRAHAARQVEEGVQALTATLPTLIKGAGPVESSCGRSAPGEGKP